ncbi:hypothetical protein GGD64_002377 [Bradyrhizobium sp. CIR3A]|nr:hypothetical protein [Bradyrhizobium sp. CIR3A]NYG48831.1 hypothetical protein [Bradyrhizobium sp. IAR9]
MISCPGRAKRGPGPSHATRGCDGPRLCSASLKSVALRPGHGSSYTAAGFTNPNASASSEYDFFRAS